MTNQLAAMPSLHVGWALWCAWVVFTLTKRRWVRIAAIAYPIGTTLVVIGTANHYVLDAVAGVLVMLFGIHVVGRLPQVIRLPLHASLPSMTTTATTTRTRPWTEPPDREPADHRTGAGEG